MLERAVAIESESCPKPAPSRVLSYKGSSLMLRTPRCISSCSLLPVSTVDSFKENRPLGCCSLDFATCNENARHCDECDGALAGEFAPRLYTAMVRMQKKDECCWYDTDQEHILTDSVFFISQLRNPFI